MTQAGQRTLDLPAVNASLDLRQRSPAFLVESSPLPVAEEVSEIGALKAFERAIDILGATARTAEEAVASGAGSLGEIEARGDRIDRLNAENRRAINELLKT